MMKTTRIQLSPFVMILIKLYLPTICRRRVLFRLSDMTFRLFGKNQMIWQCKMEWIKTWPICIRC